MHFNTHQMGEDHCPSCKSTLDAATNADGSVAKPEPGDITLCGYCGTVLEFNNTLEVQKMSASDFDELPTDTTEYILRLQRAIRGKDQVLH